MSGLNIESPCGVLRQSWVQNVGDYAIDGGWVRQGEILVVADAQGGIYAFNGRTGTSIWARQNVHVGGVLALAIHPSDAVFASAGQDGRLVIWNALNGEQKKLVTVDDGWIENIAWSSAGQWLAASCSKQVSVYDVEGNEIWRSNKHPSTVSAIAWSSPDELVTACYGRVTFFDVVTGGLSQQLNWKGSLISMALSPDGDIVACGSQDKSVHFWRRSTEKDSMMYGYPGKPSIMAFNNTGSLLATGGGCDVTVWCFEEGGPEGTHPGILSFHSKNITSLAFSNRESYLASAARDGSIVVWSLHSNGQKHLRLGAALVSGLVAKLYWRPDDGALAALDAQGGVSVWQIE